MKTEDKPDPQAFARFESLTSSLVSVPKKEIAEQEKKYKRAKKKLKKEKPS